MRVLVAGATGVVGRALVPMLRSAGHEVASLSRRPAQVPPDGVTTVSADALDRPGLAAAVRAVDPEVVVHLLTAVPRTLEPRRFRRQMAATDRLRTEGTANLVAAAPHARLVTAGVAFLYDPEGGSPAGEDRPLWTGGPRVARPVVHALVEAERRTTEAGGVVLRFGHLYGPGTHFGVDGSFTASVRARRMPVVGDGAAVFSFLHAHDAAEALARAVEVPVTGRLNVVDDDPAPVRRWLPEMAGILGAPPPRRVPAPLARLIGGAWGVAFMTALVGADNRRAREEIGWAPSRPSWRDGFAAELTVGGEAVTRLRAALPPQEN